MQNSKALIIAEKPSVARDIVAAIGGFQLKSGLPQGVSVWESEKFICTHALGHLLELFEPEDYQSTYSQWRIQDLPIVPESFGLKPKDQTAQILRAIKQQLSRPDVIEVINACDAAREGELIFREIMQHTLCDKASSRVWLQSLIHESIRTAFDQRQPASKFQGLANAAHGRSQADWLMGMNLSRAATLKLSRASEGGVWSVGRVQTPTLAMLVEREFAILSHNPHPYQLVKCTFEATDHVYEGTWIHPSFKYDEMKPHQKNNRIFDEQLAQSIVKSVEVGARGHAVDTRKTRSQKAPPLFSLTALQRYMANKYKWTAKKTLEIAQKCYEQHKVLTYPRTESEALPSDYQEKIRDIFSKLTKIPQYGVFAQNLLHQPWHNVESTFNDKEVTDHFAIIPTGQFPSRLPEDESLLFDAVIRRLLGCFMPPAQIDQVERLTVIGEHQFKSGPQEVILDSGWQAVLETKEAHDASRKRSHALLPLNTEPHVVVKDCTSVREHTKAPPRIGEAQLLSLMEHAGRQLEDSEMAKVLKASGGLGTAATRAEVIENLKQKDYIYSNLQPTVKGLHLIRFLKLARVENLISPQLTAELESQLNLVESSGCSRESFIRQTAAAMTNSLTSMVSFDLEHTFDYAPSLGPCPRCQGSVKERMWNYSCESNRTGVNPCEFILPKDCDGRWLDPPTVSRLLNADTAGIEVEHFPKSSGANKRTLKLANGLLQIFNELGQPVEQNFVVSESKSSIRRRVTWGACPVHKSEGCLIVETKNAFLCETKLRHIREGNMQGIGLQLPKSVCEKKLKFDDINAFIKSGKTKVIEGFKSKGGKIFNASIVRNPSGQWTFEFHR